MGCNIGFHLLLSCESHGLFEACLYLLVGGSFAWNSQVVTGLVPVGCCGLSRPCFPVWGYIHCTRFHVIYMYISNAIWQHLLSLIDCVSVNVTSTIKMCVTVLPSFPAAYRVTSYCWTCSLPLSCHCPWCDWEVCLGLCDAVRSTAVPPAR